MGIKLSLTEELRPLNIVILDSFYMRDNGPILIQLSMAAF